MWGKRTWPLSYTTPDTGDKGYTVSNVECQVFPPKLEHAPGPGIETRSPACQAGVLTTTIPRLSVRGGHERPSHTLPHISPTWQRPIDLQMISGDSLKENAIEPFSRFFACIKYEKAINGNAFPGVPATFVISRKCMPQFLGGNPYFFSENLYQSVSFQHILSET